MADTARSLASLQTLLADNTARDITAQRVRDFLISAVYPQHLCGGRLTTDSANPLSTADRTAQSSVYYLPAAGGHDKVGLYDGTGWVAYDCAFATVALSGLTSGKNYDVFAYHDGSSVTLYLGPAWSSDTARGTGAGTTELYLREGVLVNAVSISGGPAVWRGRYLGTIRTTGTTTTEDSAAKRFVWSLYHQTLRTLQVIVTGSHTINNVSTREWAAGTAMRAQFVFGTPQPVVIVAGARIAPASTTANPFVYPSLDGTTPSVFMSNRTGAELAMESTLVSANAVAEGYHYATILEAEFGSVNVVLDYGKVMAYLRG